MFTQKLGALSQNLDWSSLAPEIRDPLPALSSPDMVKNLVAALATIAVPVKVRADAYFERLRANESSPALNNLGMLKELVGLIGDLNAIASTARIAVDIIDSTGHDKDYRANLYALAYSIRGLYSQIEAVFTPNILLTRLGKGLDILTSLVRAEEHNAKEPHGSRDAIDPNMGFLARMTRVSGAAITEQIKKLEKHGLVRRAPIGVDRRERYALITEFGQRLVFESRLQQAMLLGFSMIDRIPQSSDLE